MIDEPYRFVLPLQKAGETLSPAHLQRWIGLVERMHGTYAIAYFVDLRSHQC